jgi:hypothetical protein
VKLWWIALFAVLRIAAFGGDPAARITFTKTFPGSNPAFMEVTIDRNGQASYKEAADDDPDTFKISPAMTQEVFNLADRVDHFKHPLESGLKVANMGAKRLRWESGDQKSETTFNYSLDENGRALQDWFERIGETERLFYTLQRAIRHDRLGVNDAMISISAEWDAHRLIMIDPLVTLLNQVATNEIYMHISRERAAKILEANQARSK